MKKYNLIVAGGGLTGVAASVSAAREGLSVLLIESSGSLGGAISNNLIFPFMPFRTNLDGSTVDLSAGIFTEIRKHHDEKFGGKLVHDFYPEGIKFVLDDMVTEAGVDVLFHATIFDVITENDSVKAVKTATKSGEMTFEADLFIDATGDGDLFYLAGCDFQLGRDGDGFCQPMTTCFRVSGVNIEKFYEELSTLQEKYKEVQSSGEITNPREDILVFKNIGTGILHFNTTRIIKLDPTNPIDVSRAEIEARKQVFEMEQFFKKYSEACSDMTVISIANSIGVRESRKLRGVHILNVDELKNCTKFEDSIACGNYDIDIHNPTGAGTSHYYFKAGEYYTIPYRSLLPKEYTNMLVAGRCISATHEAQASIRIMPICACLGEAAGVAAGVAYNSGKNAHDIDVKLLQKKLKEKGAFI